MTAFLDAVKSAHATLTGYIASYPAVAMWAFAVLLIVAVVVF